MHCIWTNPSTRPDAPIVLSVRKRITCGIADRRHAECERHPCVELRDVIDAFNGYCRCAVDKGDLVWARIFVCVGISESGQADTAGKCAPRPEVLLRRLTGPDLAKTPVRDDQIGIVPNGFARWIDQRKAIVQIGLTVVGAGCSEGAPKNGGAA